jgi:hypothetical protein
MRNIADRSRLHHGQASFTTTGEVKGGRLPSGQSGAECQKREQQPSLVFLLLLTVRMVTRGEAHIDLLLLIGSLLVCAWQFRRFRGLFRAFLRERYSSQLIQAPNDVAELPALGLSFDPSRRQTTPLSVTEQTTLGLKDANRFLIPTVPLNEPSREAHGY